MKGRSISPDKISFHWNFDNPFYFETSELRRKERMVHDDRCSLCYSSRYDRKCSVELCERKEKRRKLHLSDVTPGKNLLSSLSRPTDGCGGCFLDIDCHFMFWGPLLHNAHECTVQLKNQLNMKLSPYYAYLKPSSESQKHFFLLLICSTISACC